MSNSRSARRKTGRMQMQPRAHSTSIVTSVLAKRSEVGRLNRTGKGRKFVIVCWNCERSRSLPTAEKRNTNPIATLQNARIYDQIMLHHNFLITWRCYAEDEIAI